MEVKATVSRRSMLIDAKKGARNELRHLRKLERETGSEVFIDKANAVRKRISIYSQELNDMRLSN